MCGALYGGVLEGEHPTVQEHTVEMSVCFRRCPGCDCEGRREMAYVRNCVTHFVYWLPVTTSKHRYCTGMMNLDSSNGMDPPPSSAVECSHNKVFGSSTTARNKKVFRREEDGGWYRFSATSGLELASQCPVGDVGDGCGSNIRGWLVDRHPTVGEGRVVRKVCFSYVSECACAFFTSVYVRNCGSFFVYRINRIPFENAEYCGVPRNVVQQFPVAPPPSLGSYDDNKGDEYNKGDDGNNDDNDDDSDMCTNYTIVYDPDRLWSSKSPTMENCDALLYGNFRFGSKYTPWSLKEGCNMTRANFLDTHTYRCGAKYQGMMIYIRKKRKKDETNPTV